MNTRFRIISTPTSNNQSPVQNPAQSHMPVDLPEDRDDSSTADCGHIVLADDPLKYASDLFTTKAPLCLDAVAIAEIGSSFRTLFSHRCLTAMKNILEYHVKYPYLTIWVFPGMRETAKDTYTLTVQLLQRIRPMVYVTVCIIPTRAPFPPELLLSLTRSCAQAITFTNVLPLKSMFYPCYDYVQQCTTWGTRQDIADHFRLPIGAELLVSRKTKLFVYRHGAQTTEKAPPCQCGKTKRKIVKEDGKPAVYWCPVGLDGEFIHSLYPQGVHIYLHSSDGSHHVWEEQIM